MRRIEGSLAGRAFSRKAVAGKRLAAGGLVLAVAGAAAPDAVRLCYGSARSRTELEGALVGLAGLLGNRSRR